MEDVVFFVAKKTFIIYDAKLIFKESRIYFQNNFIQMLTMTILYKILKKVYIMVVLLTAS
jgi:hypothetical protein